MNLPSVWGLIIKKKSISYIYALCCLVRGVEIPELLLLTHYNVKTLRSGIAAAAILDLETANFIWRILETSDCDQKRIRKLFPGEINQVTFFFSV